MIAVNYCGQRIYTIETERNRQSNGQFKNGHTTLIEKKKEKKTKRKVQKIHKPNLLEKIVARFWKSMTYSEKVCIGMLLIAAYLLWRS